MMSGANESSQDASMLALISSFLGPSTSPPDDGICAEQQSHEEQQNDRPECALIGDKEVEGNRYLYFQHRIIIFSKDRPWQLQQLLRSMRVGTSLNVNYMNIFIICKVTSDYEFGYSKVKDEFDHKSKFQITWFHEDSESEDCPFAVLLGKALRDPLSNLQPVTHYEVVVKSESLVMFLTDDCIFLEPIKDIIESARSVFRNDKTLGFLTRLHPGITYSQTRDEASPPPRSYFAYHETGNELKAYVYPQRYGSKEFSYPFDLSGGVYRQKTCIDVLNKIQQSHPSKDAIPTNEKKVGYLHPNTLEINGNSTILQIQNEQKGTSDIEKRDLLAIPSQPTLLVLAINRVQKIYQAPIATASLSTDGIKRGQQENDLFTPELLSTYLENDFHLDLAFYKEMNYDSSHIGDVVLQHCTHRNEFHETISSKFVLSVLVPVHTGPPSASELAIKSILYQTLDDPCILPIQIVLVDDRCKDGSVEQMLETARDFDREHQHSHRPLVRIRNSQDANCFDKSNLEPMHPEPITIDVVRSPSPGVGTALNFGLEVCMADFVARMDADDISCPHRLISQLRYLKHNPAVKVLGTNGVIFRESRGSSPKNSDPETNLIAAPFMKEPRFEQIRSSVEPTDAGFVAWSMIFSCVIMHPSVMLRKSVFLENISYNESDNISCTEDYDLWLRLIKQEPKSVSSIPFIGVFHRKHGNRSNGDQRSRRQRKESTILSHRATKELCHLSASLEVVEALKYPNDADSLNLLNQAAELLCALEKGFFTKVGTQLSKNEAELISLDCDARLGELAVLAVEKFGRNATKHKAWNLWCQRCPDLKMERLSLLLYAK